MSTKGWVWLRRELWAMLRNENVHIYLKKLEGFQALSYRETNGKDRIDIYVDPYKTDLSRAVAHELLHHILDPIWEAKLQYELYELFICSLEDPFYLRMSKRQQKRWRQLIETKLPKGQWPGDALD